jgi:hypothetical protein
MPVYYEGENIGTRRVDFFVEEKIMIELKAITQMEKVHMAQASKGKISEPVHEMYDAGATVFYAFAYDKKIRPTKK